MVTARLMGDRNKALLYWGMRKNEGRPRLQANQGADNTRFSSSPGPIRGPAEGFLFASAG